MSEFENGAFIVSPNEIESDTGTTIMVENEYGSYMISSKDEIDHIGEFTDIILRPLLLAMGYQPDNVAELFGDNDGKSDIGVGTRFLHTGVSTIFTLDSTYNEGDIVALYDTEGVLYSTPILTADRNNVTDWEFDKITAGKPEFFEQLTN